MELKGKNSFEVEYLLTALQIHLNNDKQPPSSFIAKANHLSIFEHLSVLSELSERSPNDQKCLVICLHTLRSLLGEFNLKDSQLTVFPQLAFELPPTNVFLKLITEATASADAALLEPSFALQLTQNEFSLKALSEGAFNADKDIRILTCNFLYLCVISNRINSLDLFNISIK